MILLLNTTFEIWLLNKQQNSNSENYYSFSEYDHYSNEEKLEQNMKNNLEKK